MIESCGNLTIIGNEPVFIGDKNPSKEFCFQINDLDFIGDKKSFIMVNLQGLTHTNQDIRIQLNGPNEIGKLFSYGGENTNIDFWYTQIMTFPTRKLNRGRNEISIYAVSWPRATEENPYDDFCLKSLVLFYPKWIRPEEHITYVTVTKYIYRTPCGQFLGDMDMGLGTSPFDHH